MFSNIAIASSTDGTIYLLKVDQVNYSISLIRKEIFTGKVF